MGKDLVLEMERSELLTKAQMEEIINKFRKQKEEYEKEHKVFMADARRNFRGNEDYSYETKTNKEKRQYHIMKSSMCQSFIKLKGRLATVCDDAICSGVYCQGPEYWGSYFFNKGFLTNNDIEKGEIFGVEVGIRFCFPCQSISDIPEKYISKEVEKIEEGLYLLGYGYGFGQAPCKEIQDTLTQQFNNNQLEKLDYKCYRPCQEDEYDVPVLEYEKRVFAKRTIKQRAATLSNGETYNVGDCVWTELQPAEVYFSEMDHMIISKNIMWGESRFLTL